MYEVVNTVWLKEQLDIARHDNSADLPGLELVSKHIGELRKEENIIEEFTTDCKQQVVLVTDMLENHIAKYTTIGEIPTEGDILCLCKPDGGPHQQAIYVVERRVIILDGSIQSVVLQVEPTIETLTGMILEP